MIREFTEHLRSMGKSENTIRTYYHDIEQFLAWCRDSFGEEPAQLYRENVLEYISYMRNVRNYHPKTVNNHLSSLRSLNEYLIQAGCQAEVVVLDGDFMKIQIQYASPCTVGKRMWRHSGNVFWKAATNGTIAWSRFMPIPESGGASV